MGVESGLRPVDALTAARSAVLANRDRYSAHAKLDRWLPHIDGELAAIDWVIGRVDTSPVAHRTDLDPENRADLDRERQVATEMLHRNMEMHRRGRAYVSAVETTLMWILGESDSEPF